MFVNIAIACPVEIPIGMIGQIHGRGLIGGGLIFKNEFILIGQPIGGLGLKIAWIAFFAIRAEVGKNDRLFASRCLGLGLPEDFVKTVDSTMQMVWVLFVIDRFCQRIRIR